MHPSTPTGRHIIVLLSLLGALCSPARSDDVDQLQDRLGNGFRIYHSPHFSLLTDAEEAVDKQAEILEDVYDTFYREAGAIGLQLEHPTERLVCVLFGSHRQWREYLASEKISVAWASGFYSPRTNRIIFYHDPNDPLFKDVRKELARLQQQIGQLRDEINRLPEDDTARRPALQEKYKRLKIRYGDFTRGVAVVRNMANLATARHEATHQICFNSGLLQRQRHYPFWLGEGLAMLFEPVDTPEQRAPAQLNALRLPDYQRMLRDGRSLQLASLLTERISEDDAQRALAERYARAWVLMHYLWNNRSRDLREFLEGAAQRRPDNWVELFKAHFGDDLARLEEQIAADYQR